MYLKFINLILLVFLFTNSQAQETSQFTIDSLDNYIIKAMQDWKIPGAAVCIVKDDKIIHQKGYGVTVWNSQSKVDTNTIFSIASVTKTFTGTAFATLEAEGKLSLNDLVKKWLPWFEMKDSLYEQQLNLTDILSHRSGWKTFQGDLLNTESSLDRRTMLGKFGKLTPAYPIRTKFGYSNFGFLIAGEVIQNVTNSTWNSFIQNRFLIPLDMDRTFVFGEDIQKAYNKVTGHTTTNDSILVLPKNSDSPFSDGGMFTSIHDLGTWMRVLLNQGMYNGKNIIPESAIQKSWRSNTIIGKSKAADRELYLKTYGLGWEIFQYNCVEVIQHGGAYSGVLSMMALIPSKNLGIAILTNQDNHLLHETLKWQVIDYYINKKAPDYTQVTIDRQKKRKAENQNQTKNELESIEPLGVNLDSIIGEYRCEYYGKAFIRKEKDSYILKLEFHPQIEGVLTDYKKDTLQCKYNNTMFGTVNLPFFKNTDRIKGFTLFVDPFVETDGYEFIKK